MFVAIDLETTGLDKYNDRIIEVGIIKFDKNTFEIIEEFSSFIDPDIPIPDLITNITNINDSDILGAPFIEDIKYKIKDFIGDYPILGQNIGFDIGFLVKNDIDISDNIFLDTFFLSNFLCTEEKSLNLEALCNSFGICFSGAHRALNDIKATVKLFEKLVIKFRKLKKIEKELLYYIFSNSYDENIIFMKNYLFTDFIGSFNLGQIENILLKSIGIGNKEKDIIFNQNLDITDMSKLYDSFGNLEKRKNQLSMTEMVLDTLKESKKSLIEAPTGLGKSFAYLLPSIIHSVSSGQKVFVSTKTKALQDQLFEKDLKFLSEKLGFNFNYSKLKGKKNYLGIKNFFEELFLDNLSFEKVTFMSKIVLWLLKTNHGELDELNYYGLEYTFLKHISSDSFITLKDDNKYKEYEFLFKARNSINSSNIIVINHSLLFSDIVSESSILGNLDNLILDEAHSIDDSITDSLKKSFNRNTLEELFSFINDIFNKKEIKKLDIMQNQDDLLSNIDVILDYAYSYLNTKVKQDSRYKTTLITGDFFIETDFKDIISKIELLFIDIIDILSIIKEFDFIREKGILQDMLGIIKLIINKNSLNKFICIISYNERFGLSIEYTLLNPGTYLKENLWDNLRSVLLTSATLKIGDSFNYFKEILSLSKDFHFSSFDSDFNYKKQATLFIPNDLGDIKSNSSNIIEFLGEFYLLVRGRVLTLLTSFSIIRKIYIALNIGLKKEGINLYTQNIGGSKNKLLSFYLENSYNSILLGTDSFWEGIDIPGDKLKYLVIHKFPFGVPIDPIFQARSSLFNDSFIDYAIPKAIIKLKQGFGRLIRSKTDTGVVIFLDNRIYSTKWGKEFYKAFPNDINIKTVNSKVFLNILQEKMTK